jgi:hypothetical protein
MTSKKVGLVAKKRGESGQISLGNFVNFRRRVSSNSLCIGGGFYLKQLIFIEF